MVSSGHMQLSLLANRVSNRTQKKGQSRSPDSPFDTKYHLEILNSLSEICYLTSALCPNRCAPCAMRSALCPLPSALVPFAACTPHNALCALLYIRHPNSEFEKLRHSTLRFRWFQSGRISCLYFCPQEIFQALQLCPSLPGD